MPRFASVAFTSLRPNHHRKEIDMQDKADPSLGQSSPATAQQSPEPIQAAASTGSASGSPRHSASSSAIGAGPSSTGAMDKAKETISDVASQAGDKVASNLDIQKDRAAEGLGSVARALRQASDQLRGQNQGAAIPEYISSAGNQVERLSGYLRSTSTRDIVKGAEQFARQQPALFVGGAFILGVLGARFLKSSGHSSSSHSSSAQISSMPPSEGLVPRDSTHKTPTYARGYSGAQGVGTGASSGTTLARGGREKY
jgi:hypothetical protein